jgi:dTDP-4-amino-4,6-dideoxygalactose transaminase
LARRGDTVAILGKGHEQTMCYGNIEYPWDDKKIAKKYFESFKDKNYILGQSGVIEGHAYHLYIIHITERDGLYEFLRLNNIYCQVHYFPLHLMPYYENKQQSNLDSSESYIKTCLSLPMYPSLENKDLDSVIDCIKNYYE